MDPTLITRMLLSLGLWASPVAPAPLPVWEVLTTDESAALRELDDGSLDAQRAGALEHTAPLDDAERDALRRAADDELLDQRGGDIHLTDREIKIILWTAATVAILFIIL
jgi:hypothetical protein